MLEFKRVFLWPKQKLFRKKLKRKFYLCEVLMEEESSVVTEESSEPLFYFLTV